MSLVIHVENLLTVEFLTSVCHSLLDGLSCSLQELLFLELELFLDLLSLDVGDEERGNEVLDEDFGLVLLGFDLVDELVECLSLEFGFVVGLE